MSAYRPEDDLEPGEELLDGGLIGKRDDAPEYGKPTDLRAPDLDTARALLLRVERLLQPGQGSKRNLDLARRVLREANDYEVWTQNCLNPEAGLFPIHARSKDSCCDPSTERYHSM